MKPRRIFFDDSAGATETGAGILDRASSLGVPVLPMSEHVPPGDKRDLAVRIRKGRWLKTFADACACGRNEFFLCAVEGCPHDCAYCYVMGYLKDQCPTIYANTADLMSELSLFLAAPQADGARVHAAHLGELVEWEDWTGACATLGGLFSRAPRTVLEIRTKTDFVTAAAWSGAPGNVVFSWSLTPARFRDRFEPGLPGPQQRLAAAAHAAGLGARIALRLDPVLMLPGWEKEYSDLAALAGSVLSRFAPDSIEIGAFRCSAGAAAAVRAGPGKEIMACEVFRSEDGKYRYSWQERVRAYRLVSAALERAFGGAVPVRLVMEPGWIQDRVES